MHNTSYVLAIGVLAGVIGAVIGGAVMLWFAYHTDTNPSALTQRERTTTEGTPSAASSQRIGEFAGTVVDISNGTLEIAVAPGSNGAPQREQVSVTLTDETDIYRRGREKTAAELAAEQQAFYDALVGVGGDDQVYVAPDAYEHIALDSTDITTGMFVRITTAANESDDIRAVRVEVLGTQDGPFAN